MASIRVENVTKRFREVVAVSNLNLEVADREFISLVGPSGCGKSTTLGLLSGLEEADEGDIFIGDNLMNDVPPGDRNIAMMFQSYALYPHMKVATNLAFGLEIRRIPRADIAERVREVAQLLEIEELLQRKPGQLSGGQRQRVALGRAIVRDPDVFLLDEPLSNLDAILRLQMRADLRLLFKRLGSTVIYVTHDQAEAMTMSDRLVVFRLGEVQQIGTPIDVYDRPANLFVARFVGSPPINFIPGRLATATDGHRFEAQGFSFSLPQGMVGTEWPAEVVIGIRPEDLSLQPAAIKLQGAIELIEHLGSETIIYVDVAGTRMIFKADKSPVVKMDERVDLYIDPSSLHIFDAATEQRLEPLRTPAKQNEGV